MIIFASQGFLIRTASQKKREAVRIKNPWLAKMPNDKTSALQFLKPQYLFMQHQNVEILVEHSLSPMKG